MTLTIRAASRADDEAIWQMFHEVVMAGEAYPFDPSMTRAEALAYWFAPGTHAFVATENDTVLGSYVVRPNQPGRGAHIANAAFLVAPAARRRGIGRSLGEHALAQARRLGYRAMQFNMVVATNLAAVRLWQQLGFVILATLPGAFRHAALGFVDVHIMFRTLENA